MKATLAVLCFLSLAIFQDSNCHAQAFENDNDGLLDVGEVQGFPPDPALVTGIVGLNRRGIEDLDGLNLLINVDELYITRNNISSFEHGDFVGLTNMKILDFRGSGVMKIEAHAFEGLESLQELDLGGNRITRIVAGTFKGLTDLQELRLGGSGIEEIETGGFRGLDSLTNLSLRSHKISSIQPGAFNGLHNLKSLDLGRNAITTIEQGVFHGLNNLESLDLRDNAIDSIEKGDLDGLNNLERLYMGYNSIANLESGVFHGLDNLQELWLRDNSIANLRAGVFDGLSALQSLHVYRSNIRSIESGAFQEMAQLRDLNLTDSDLTKLNLSAATFHNLWPGVDGGSFKFGFLVDSDEIKSLILDDANLSLGSFDAIAGETTSVVDVSLVGLSFTDEGPADLSAVLGIPSLDNVRVDTSLYDLYAMEFDAFAAMPGNTLTIVPEPTAVSLILAAIARIFGRRLRHD